MSKLLLLTSMFVVLPVVTSCPLPGGEAGSVTGDFNCEDLIMNKSGWTGNMGATLSIKLVEAITTFTISLQLDNPVKSFVFWEADITPSSGTTFTVTSKSWFEGKGAGESLDLGFQLDFDGPNTPRFTSILFNSKNVCDGAVNSSRETTSSVDTDSNDTHNWGKECEEPCSGPQCDQLAEIMRFLVDFTVDPCDDFFGFACSAKTRGTKSPIPKKLTMDFKQLVKFPPEGFEYVKKFYLSCTRINTGYTTEEVFMQCFKDGKCDERELMKYGDIFNQFLRFTYEFINKTMLPVVTSDWEERTRDIFGGQGWNWWDFASSGFKDFFFLEAFHTVVKYENVLALDIFRSNIFFTPMIDSISAGESDLYPKIHIVPMSVPKRLTGNDMEYFDKYKSFMRSFFLAFGANSKSIDDEVEKIFEMEQQVGKINPNVWFCPACETSDYEETDDETSSNSTNSNLNETSDLGSNSKSDDESKSDDFIFGYFEETITIDELYYLVPSVEWKDYIEGAFNHNFKVRKTTKVRIPSRSLMVDMGKWIESLSSRDKANLLIWRMFIKFANDFMHTGAEVGDLQHNGFSSNIEKDTRPDNCIKQIKALFPFAHDDMFISKYIDNKTREALRKTFKGLTREFEEIIEETEWMSQRTRIRAIEKLRAMNIIVGETSPNTKAFKALKKQMSSKNYIENILAISNYNWITLSKNINKEKKVAYYPADTNNAYYSQNDNEVEILPGLITYLINEQGLSFDIQASLISTTLGHEIVHGFDSVGRKYDKDGFRLNWWTPSEEEIYANRTQCLIDQYANFTIAYNDTEYQITETSYPPDENIADNGGVKAAYRSYQRLPEDEKKCLPDPDLPFTADQLFFLGHAFFWCTLSGHEYVEDYKSLLMSKPSKQGHVPAPWRVNTVLANQPEFSKAFKCPVGSRLNPRPENRCTIW